MRASSKMERGEVVVVTGAAGCLGYHTIKLLISQDDRVSEVRCLDLREPEKSFKKSIDDELERHNSNCDKHKKVHWVQGDIRDINLVERTLEKADCVIHCAARIDIWVEKSEQNAEELLSVNVDGTETLLKTSIRLGVYKFIHVSSFEVFTSLDTIYFATENTLPEIKKSLFGPSGNSKIKAEVKVRQYSNNKLQNVSSNEKDSLNAIIVRFPEFYGEYEKYYVSRLMKITKRFFNGRLQRLSNIWIKRQPIYVGNAAWALVKAKQKMDVDHSVSGEEFHITDETAIDDPFNFMKPFLKCKGLGVTNGSYSSIPVYILLSLLLMLRRLLSSLDPFGLITSKKKNRLQEAIEKDQQQQTGAKGCKSECVRTNDYDDWNPGRWYDVVTPQMVGFLTMSAFLNRTKASLRLDYEPIYGPEEAHRRSIEWYEKLEL